MGGARVLLGEGDASESGAPTWRAALSRWRCERRRLDDVTGKADVGLFYGTSLGLEAPSPLPFDDPVGIAVEMLTGMDLATSFETTTGPPSCLCVTVSTMWPRMLG